MRSVVKRGFNVPGHKGFVSIPLEERFWNKVDKRGDDECWPWLGSLSRRGYGQATVSNGKNRVATKVAWELFHKKPWPEGKLACHTCDNPPCVNPKHIWPGTMSENIQDASAKGRLVRNPNPWNRNKPECKRGHKFIEGSYRLMKSGSRACLTCEKRRRKKGAKN